MQLRRAVEIAPGLEIESEPTHIERLGSR